MNFKQITTATAAMVVFATVTTSSASAADITMGIDAAPNTFGSPAYAA